MVSEEELNSTSSWLTQDSAHNGRDAALDSEQGMMEFCTIALHITLVVYRA